MRSLLKKIIRTVLRIPFTWTFIRYTLGKLSGLYALIRGVQQNIEFEASHRDFYEKCSRLFSQRLVLNGPFKGLQYPTNKSVGSSYYPKLIGSYEKEIEHILNAIPDQPYEAIVNIGCAEGYFIVGLGTRLPDATLYAFDSNPEAIELSKEMAEINNVDVKLEKLCTKHTLLDLDLGKKAFILCDCEGYEYELFDEETVSHLANHDFLIETHDFIRIDITQKVWAAFSNTHDCELVESVDDIIKAYTYEFEELRNFDLEERYKLLAEDRPKTMRWIHARSRN